MYRKFYVNEVCVKYQHEVHHGYTLRSVPGPDGSNGKTIFVWKKSNIPGRQGWSLRNTSTLRGRKEM